MCQEATEWVGKLAGSMSQQGHVRMWLTLVLANMCKAIGTCELRCQIDGEDFASRLVNNFVQRSLALYSGLLSQGFGQ